MSREQAQQAVEELVAAVYPANMRQIIMDAFLKAPNAEDPAYWENIRQGLAAQASGTVQQSGAQKEEGDWSVEVVNGKSVKITGYNGNDTVIQIPAQLLDLPVTVIGRRAFRDKKLTSVAIPDSVTSIEDMAFAKNQIASATIGKSVASIGESAFEKNQLAGITIPGSVASIGKWAFTDNQLADVTICDGVTSIGEKAFEKNKLAGITIPGSVTSIGDGAFAHNQLVGVTIPGGITSIGDSVFANNLIAAITIPGNVTSIGDSAFRDNKIAEITIPDSLKSVGKEAFHNNELTLVTVPDSLTSIGEKAFGDASVIRAGGDVVAQGKDEENYETTASADGKSVVITRYKVSKWMRNVRIPSLINGLPVTGIADKAFYHKDTVNVTVPDSVTFIGNEAFAENKVESINIPAGVTSIGNRAFAKSDIAAVAIPDSVTSIGDSAFEECRKLASVTLGGGITAIGTKTFRRCNLGAGIIIPSSVTSIGEQAFFQSGLTALTVQGSIASVGEKAFYGNALASINIQGSIGNIGKEAFANNESAEGDLMVLYADDIKSIIVSGYKGKEKELIIPSQIRGLPVIKIFQEVLGNGITSITIPDNVFIGDGITSYMHKIKSVTIGSNVTIGKVAITIDTITALPGSTYMDLIGIDGFSAVRTTKDKDYIAFINAYNGKAGTYILSMDDKTDRLQWSVRRS